MQKIAKPNPVDYGLTEEQYRRQKVILLRLERIAALLLPAFIWTIVFILSLSMVQGSPGALAGVVGGGVLFVVCSKVFRFVLHNLPVYKKIKAYETDLRKYGREKALIDRKGIEKDLSLRRRKSGYWKNLTEEDLKSETARLYSELGFTVEMVSEPDANGFDMVISKDNKRAIVKCVKSGSRVGARDVSKLYDAMISFGADKAVIVAAAGATQGAVNFIKDKPLEVVDAAGLAEMSGSIDN